MNSIIWLGVIILLISIAGIVWNIYRTDKHVITGSSVSLIFSFFVGIALVFEPSSISLPWVTYEKIKKEAERSELAAKAMSEVMAIQQWNQGRLPDDKGSLQQKKEAVKIFKQIYGNDYNKQLQVLHKRGLILAIPEDVKTNNEVDLTIDKPYFEMINKKN